MSNKNISYYPYPVLRCKDDYNNKLDSNSVCVKNTQDKKNYNFSIELLLENQEILDLISSGDAEFTCEITCPRTYYRHCLHSDVPGFSFSIGRKEVIGEITFACYVTAKKTVKDYRNSDFNEDYEDATFDMEPGDIFVEYPKISYKAALKYDKLYSAGSFMVVLEEKERDNVWYDSNGDKIVVFLPTPMFEQFKLLSTRQEFNELFHASIVFNALVQALIQYDPKEQGTPLWVEAIRYRINTEEELKNFNLDDKKQMFALAQALLADPYRRMFNRLGTDTADTQATKEED